MFALRGKAKIYIENVKVPTHFLLVIFVTGQCLYTGNFGHQKFVVPGKIRFQEMYFLSVLNVPDQHVKMRGCIHPHWELLSTSNNV